MKSPLERVRCRFESIALPTRTPRAAPVLCGIYLLVDAGEIVYVGSSVDVVGRLYAHMSESRWRRGKVFDEAFWYARPAAVHRHYEGAFIRALLPRYNAKSPAHTGDDNEILEGFCLTPHADEHGNAAHAVSVLSRRRRARIHSTAVAA